MSDVYSYLIAAEFRVHLYLGGLGAQPIITHSVGEAAERDAAGRIRAHDESMSDRDRKMKPSSFAHIEYVIPSGPQHGLHSTYARFGGQQHAVTRYVDDDAPGGIRYWCRCGAQRCSTDEITTHWEIAGTCTFCGGEEDVHPPSTAPLAVGSHSHAWVPCPACGGTGDYVAEPPEFDREWFFPDHSIRRPLPLSAAGHN